VKCFVTGAFRVRHSSPWQFRPGRVVQASRFARYDASRKRVRIHREIIPGFGQVAQKAELVII
jgi:hypothetical protein